MAKPVEIPGFELLGLLGRGGMGDVYRARQLSTGRRCAIKVTRSDRADERGKARFQREAESMVRVKHPNLIQLFDAGSVGDDLWIAIELIEGASLDRVLAAQGALSPELSCRLMLETCQALEAMHRQGLLHRDVKPGNIMIEKGTARAVLMDLGLAKDPTKTALTQTGHLLGTPVYLPREVFTGTAFDSSVDFYSIGITWWELLSGERPYDFQDMMDSLTKGTELTIPPPRSPHGEVPPRHLSLIQALTDDRDLRPASWVDVQALLDGRPMPLRPGGGSDAGTRPLEGAEHMSGVHLRASTETGARPGRSRLALAVPSVALALAGILGVLWPTGSGDEAPGGRRDPLQGPPPLVFDRTWADRHSVVLRGTAPIARAVRATRQVDGREVPVAVYPIADHRFLVWVTGLEPGTAVHLTATAGDETMGARAASVRSGEHSLGESFPSPLRRFHPRDDAPVLGRQLETILGMVDTGEVIDNELVWASADIALFRNFPDGLWPSILALLERGGPVTENLLRCMKLARTLVPRQVAWHLVHRFADPAAPLASRDHWDIGIYYFEGSGVPLAAPARLVEWGGRGLAEESLFRLASITARTLGDRSKVPVFPGDSWDQGELLDEEVDPLPHLDQEGLAGLMGLAVRARRGETAALDGLLEVAFEPAHPLSDWALAILGSAGDQGLVEALLGEYARASDRRELAARASLMSLRTVAGLWTPKDLPMLLRVSLEDLSEAGEVAGASVDGGHPVVWKPGREAGFTLVPGEGAVIRIRLTGGETRVYRLRAKGVPVRLE